MKSNVMIEDIAPGMEEQVVAAKEKGVLPVEVEVPRQGNLISLKKVLAVSGEPSTVFIIQLQDLISLILSLCLLYYLTTWLQAAIVESINNMRIKTKTIAWAAAGLVIFVWILWNTDWFVWVAGILGAAIAALRIGYKAMKERKQQKKKKR
jgi:hypothetical protein